jgi:hypothetical protein
MEHLQPFLDRAIDASNDPAIRTLVVSVVPGLGALLGLYLFWRWRLGRDLESQIDGIAEQNQLLQRTIGELVDQMDTIDATTRAWRRLHEPVSLLEAAATNVAHRSAEKSKLARALLQSGHTNAARALFKELSQLRQEAASLIEQAQPIATLLEKRLDYLNKSDAEMAKLVRELVE